MSDFTTLDLALTLPKSFDNLTLIPAPKEGLEGCAQVEITSSYKSARILNISAFCPLWDCMVKIAIFNARPWHLSAFKPQKTVILHGKLSLFNDCWQFTNPKIVKSAGAIVPHYKKNIKDSELEKLISERVTASSLIAQKLTPSEAQMVLKLHENTVERIDLISFIATNEPLKRLLKLMEILNYSSKLSSKKRDFKAISLTPSPLDSWLATLPFSPTNDQIKAIDDIKGDLASPKATKRVIMGDVGSGKTLIMLASAMMARPHKSIIMAPTSILAQQIYSEAKRLLPSDFCVSLVQKGDKNIDESATLLIGTHALLYHELPNAPLIMVDEQHRFGSNQRHKIEKLASSGDADEHRAHFLQFSATPIPRTLGLIESNLVSFSFLKEIPFQKNITTKILDNTGFSALLSHLDKQIKSGHQAIIVYPLVEASEKRNYQSLEEASSWWQKRFKRVFITHGKDRDKEQIIDDFNQNGDILLCTTIIEVGISLPRLSTIVIVGAELLGLASLHQLRGRVGRGGGDGWCYLYTKMSPPPKRLEEFCQTLDGFKIAQLDLQNRQSGDILSGVFQHGAIFEYYNFEEDITAEAIARLKT